MSLDPRTVRRVSVEPSVPEPADCLPPGESVDAAVELSDGWLAVSGREVLVYRTDRDPPLLTVPLPNVTGVALRRAGDGPVLRYAPRIAAYGLVSVIVGLLLEALVPSTAVDVPQGSPAAGAFGFVRLLTDGIGLLGDAAVLLGVVVMIGALGALGYRLATGGRVVVVEQAGGSGVRCTAAGGSGRRALRQLATTFEAPGDGSTATAATGPGGEGAAGTGSDSGSDTGSGDDSGADIGD
jgi:hypothetical protein